MFSIYLTFNFGTSWAGFSLSRPVFLGCLLFGWFHINTRPVYRILHQFPDFLVQSPIFLVSCILLLYYNMVAFALIPFLFAGVSPLSSFAAPLQGLTTTASFKGTPIFPPINYGLLCDLPLLKGVCSRIAAAQSGIQVTTPIGVAQGVSDGSANRFAVKYASATRWAASTVATKWTFP